ncbi:MAG: TIGR03435 family protein [Acidobacteriota bacterium]
MIRSAVKLAAAGVLALTTFGQTGEKPRFLAANVHVNGRPTWFGARQASSRGDYLEAKDVTLADLIGFAYNTAVSQVVGGPSWLEMDRFDVIAKAPPRTPPDQQKVMLQALLAERFKLVVREDSRSVPQYALTSGSKHKLKQADNSEAPGCTPQSSGTATNANTVILTNSGTTPVQISLTEGTIGYKCRNISMAAFAAGMREMVVANLGVNPVLDQTGLAGNWSFDLKYSILPGVAGGPISIFEAIDRQLGLKLEAKQIPTTVMLVESAERKPIDNPAGTAEALPPAGPKPFEVATIKVSNPDSTRVAYTMQPGGRLNAEGMPLSYFINRAFSQRYTGEVFGMPSWADTVKIDVVAQLASDGGPQFGVDNETFAPALLGLLKERFGMTYHMEQRELQAYELVAEKPKMKREDPEVRAWCKPPAQVPGAPPAPQGWQALICRNITMTQFAELLYQRTFDLKSPIANATGLEGGWDFTLTFNPTANPTTGRAVPRSADSVAGPTPIAASDPVAGYTIFEAIEKQLGLELKKTKLSMPVPVIDHIDQTPSDN